MKQKVDPNQPAFSRSAWGFSNEDYDPGTSGMTLRQYYAGQAMMAIMSRQNGYTPQFLNDISEKGFKNLAEYFAHEAVFSADALIAELNKETE